MLMAIPEMRCSARRAAGFTIAPPSGRFAERACAAVAQPHALRASRLLGRWLRGLGRPTPFFDDYTNAPLSSPHLLTPIEARHPSANDLVGSGP